MADLLPAEAEAEAETAVFCGWIPLVFTRCLPLLAAASPVGWYAIVYASVQVIPWTPAFIYLF